MWPARVDPQADRQLAPSNTTAIGLAFGPFLVHSRATMPLFPDPTSGDPIAMTSGKLEVPDHPILPFIEGDGTGPDIWRASQRVFDAAVEKAFRGKKKIVWKEVLAGEKAFNKVNNWLPDET